jgi:hypothetical protein
MAPYKLNFIGVIDDKNVIYNDIPNGYQIFVKIPTGKKKTGGGTSPHLA